ncbi:probable transposase [Psychromonas ingrahamii 37]|uniref:Probable transposase n=1 Tax=Psychromonas ingrahamii (strain DSM 17664 / CCUG 51855 / 37) TaxID=357804 RepID=A1SRL3_PSYIN|nr:probable transposase [Psychromonas ingrahamii 37]
MSNSFKWGAGFNACQNEASVKNRGSRLFTGKLSSLIISKPTSGKHYVLLLVKEDFKLLPAVNKTVWIDVGIKDLAICSDDTKFNNPRLTVKYAAKLAKASRRLAKIKKGSNYFNKQKEAGYCLNPQKNNPLTQRFYPQDDLKTYKQKQNDRY